MAWLRDPDGHQHPLIAPESLQAPRAGASVAQNPLTASERPAEEQLARLSGLVGSRFGEAVMALVVGEPMLAAQIVGWAVVRWEREHFIELGGVP